VFLAGSIALLTNIAIREKQFKKIAYAGVVQNTSNAVSRVALGKASLTKIGLILSNVVALLASASVLFGIRKKLSNKTTLGEEINTALKYKDFPIYNGTRSALSQVSSNLPFLFLPGFFESDQIGIFSLAFIMLTTPVNLIIGSLFTSFFEKLSSSQKLNEPLMPLVKQYWKSLCIYILPLFVIAILLAKPLFPFVFGNRWEVAGTYFSYLAPWGFMMLLINPFYSIFIIFRKQKAFLLIDILYLTVRVIALYIGVLSADFKLCVICFSLSGILFTIIYFSRIYHILQQYEKKLI
jgi:O-antigen/teichoic acid export membrane protein